MPASSEFITLCQTQVALLIDNFGASLSAVYLTEDPTAESETALIPLVVFPEVNRPWPDSVPLALPQGDSCAPRVRTPSARTQGRRPLKAAPLSTLAKPKRLKDAASKLALSEDLEPTRLVLPLVHEDMMWGLLVVAREQHHWRQQEQAQLEHIAHTLAIACVLDQRSQWLAQGHDQQKFLQAQQHDTLSTLLHQFRNPLTTLRTLGKLLLRRLNPSDANRNLAESIVGESDRLESLLHQFDNAIDLGEAALESELESEPLPTSSQPALPPSANWLTGGTLMLQPCWLSEILQPCLDAIAGRIDEQSMGLHVTLPEDFPPVKANVEALQEVFGNLLDNALKYSPRGAEMWVNLERNTSELTQRVSISDSGCGIPTQDLGRIFERSYRGVQAETAIPGTGLGLAIARDLMDQMGGSIQALSPAIVPEVRATENGGSTFVVQLPEYAE